MTGVVIVDTNVPIVANGDSDTTPDCQERCVLALLEVVQGRQRVAIDDGGLLLEEYTHRLRGGGQGVGDAFLLWLYNCQWDAERCDQVRITRDPASNDECDFVEFPKSPQLTKFDRSDRKFVAVAVAHPERPPILEAADAKWVGWERALIEAGVTVQFLCEHELREKYEKKFGAGAAPAQDEARTKKGWGKNGK